MQNKRLSTILLLLLEQESGLYLDEIEAQIEKDGLLASRSDLLLCLARLREKGLVRRFAGGKFRKMVLGQQEGTGQNTKKNPPKRSKKTTELLHFFLARPQAVLTASDISAQSGIHGASNIRRLLRSLLQDDKIICHPDRPATYQLNRSFAERCAKQKNSPPAFTSEEITAAAGDF